LKQQIKTLNNALSNSELNNSKKIFKNDKNNRSYKLITISPHKNKESVHSNIKSILFKRKIKTSNNVKKKNYLNNLNKSYNKRNKYSESYKNITEFNIEEKKNLNIKNNNNNNLNNNVNNVMNIEINNVKEEEKKEKTKKVNKKVNIKK
jgi:hypothetical protein